MGLGRTSWFLNVIKGIVVKTVELCGPSRMTVSTEITILGAEIAGPPCSGRTWEILIKEGNSG